MQHENVVWGTRCDCGRSCSILQNKFHPWSETDFVVRLECPGCGRTHRIDQRRADAFYDRKLHDLFRDVSGTVLDLGCGGGFVSRFVLGLETVRAVHGIDCDEGCHVGLGDLLGDDRFHFLCRDVSDLGPLYEGTSIDHVVGRDILMFVPDPDRLVADIAAIAGRGVRLVGWFEPDDPRVRNTVSPEEFMRKFEAAGCPCTFTTLDWYRSGYVISGDR